MPLERGQCESCGAILEVDSSAKLAICKYCNTPYIVKEAINHYQTHIGTLHVDNLTVHSELTSTGRLEAAEAFMKIKKYNKAMTAFKEVCNLTPQDYRGWWGQVRVITEEFTKWIVNQQHLHKLYILYQNALTFAPEQAQREINDRFDAYYTPLSKYYTRRSAEIQQEINNLAEHRARLAQYVRQLELENNPHFDFPFKLLAGVLIALLVTILMYTATKNAFSIFLLINIACFFVWALIVRPIINAKTKEREGIRLQSLARSRQEIENRNREIWALQEELRQLIE